MEEETGRSGVERAGVAGASEESGGGDAAKDVRTRPARFDYGRLWRVVTFGLLAAAGALVFLGHKGVAFFAAGLGACAWFLNVRAALIRKHDLVKVGGRNWRPRREVERELEEREEGDEG